MGTDDDMPDKFEAWLENLDNEQLMAYAEEYGRSKVQEVVDWMDKQKLDGYIPTLDLLRDSEEYKSYVRD